MVDGLSALLGKGRAMKTKIIGAMVVAVLLAGLMAGTARADFVLAGGEHLDVATTHTTGRLFNASTADVLVSGHIENAYVNNEARLQVGGGRIGMAWVYNAGQIIISNGFVSNELRAYDTSAVGISGGLVNYLYATDSSTVDISGGNVLTGLIAHETSTVNISGGDVLSNLTAYNTSTVDISGGNVCGVGANDSSTVNISGGSLYYGLSATDSSTVDISGGQVYQFNAFGTSTVDISGGLVGSLDAYGSSTVTFYGYDFRATGGLSLDGDKVLGTGVLSGRWSGPDDTIWAIPIRAHDSGATISLVLPEPATLSLLALGGLAMLRRRRGMA